MQRSHDIEVKAYAQETMQQWITERLQIPQLIGSLQTQIRQSQTSIQSLQVQLQQIRENIKPLDLELKALDSQISIINATNETEKLKQKIPAHEARLAILSPELDEVNKVLIPIQRLEDKIRILEIRESISALEHEISHIQSEIDTHQREADQERSAVYQLNSQLSSINSQISSLEFSRSVDQVHHAFDYHDHHHHHHHHNHGILHTIGDISESITLSSLRSTRDDLEAKRQAAQRCVDSQQSHVASYRRELMTKTNEISRLKSDLRYYSSDMQQEARGEYLGSLRQAFQALKARKYDLVSRKQALDSDIAMHRNELDVLRGGIKHQTSIIQTNTPNLNNYPAIACNSDLADLRKQINVLNEKKSPLSGIESGLTSQIRDHERFISRSESSIHDMNRRKNVLEHDKYLVNFFDHPLQLLAALEVECVNQIERFDIEHATRQSIAVRKCIIELDYKRRFITEQQQSDLQASEFQRLQYYQLCGLLWSLLARVEQQKEDQIFANVLRSLLSQSRLDPHVCQNSFEALSHAYPQKMHVLSDEELHACEVQQFHHAEKEFRAALPAVNTQQQEHEVVKDCREKGLVLVNKITANKDVTSKANEPGFDIKYNTTVLRKATEIAKAPVDPMLPGECESLANQEEAGKPSLCKKIGGLLLSFVGAVKTLAGSLLTAAAFGKSVLGLKVANTPLAKGIGIATTCVGVGLLACGWGLFKSGKRKGVSKDIHEFVKAARRVPMDAIAPQQARPSAVGMYSTSVSEVQMMEKDKLLEPSAPLYGFS